MKLKEIVFLGFFAGLLFSCSHTIDKQKDTDFNISKNQTITDTLNTITSTVYTSAQGHLILTVNDSIISGYVYFPSMSKFDCSFSFMGKNTANKYNTAVRYYRIGDAVQTINDSNFVFKLVDKKLIVHYKTEITGCSEFVFPQSNLHNAYDTFNLIGVGDYKNPRLALIKEKQMNAYYSNFSVLPPDFVIYHDGKIKNVVSFNWENTERYLVCNMKELNVKPNDIILKIPQMKQTQITAKPLLNFGNQPKDSFLIEVFGDIENKMSFTKISEQEYKKHSSQPFLTFPKITKTKKEFSIPTHVKKYRFKPEEHTAEKGTNGWSFLGYYPTLKLFAVSETSTSESLNFSELFLIDSVTSYVYQLPSFYDGHGNMPIPSINQKRLIYYDNATYLHKNSDMLIVKIGDKTNPKTYLTATHYHHSDDFRIDEIHWLNDAIFVLKGYEELYIKGKWVNKYVYYKVTIKE